MQLSRPLWVLLAFACALILLSSNAINSWTTVVSSNQARSKYISLHVGLGEPKAQLPPSTLLAFVGVVTATNSERRQAVRSSWFPSSEAELARLEADTSIRFRFVVGQLQDPVAQAALDQEQRDHQDFLVLKVQESYENMILKAYMFLQDVQARYNPEFIIKTDDDVYIRPDRLAQAIPQWQAKGSGYIGAMRAGGDAHDVTSSPWYEPLGVLYSKKYHMYASGGFYALSSEAVQLLTEIPLSQRRLSGGSDDTTIGLWVLGYNIPYLDDRRLAIYAEKDWITCPDNFIVMTGPCNGLCDAVDTLAKLHQDPNCTKPVTADLPMLDSYYDFRPVGCIKVGEDGNINKTSCFQ
ncbi:hypothetical protein WJX79_007394 [Trebouxia sp. C0005]